MGAELNVTGLADEPGALADVSGFVEAIRLASPERNRITWLTDHGRRVAAIVPVHMAEELEH